MRTTSDIATPVSELVTAHADELLLDVLDRMPSNERRIVVVEGKDHVVGLVTPTDLVRTIKVARLREELAV
jgi:CBS domain-containing protein